MGENLARAGITFRRADRSRPAFGTTMRLRGGAIVKGEIVRVDTTSTDALTNTDYDNIDLGSETVASSPLATVIKASAATEFEILGVALESAADDALVRVEFAQGGIPVIVEALAGDTITVGLGLMCAADARLDPTTGAVVGKVIAIALEAGSDGSLIDVLFYGNAGTGFSQT
jgi:hypothetical protein